MKSLLTLLFLLSTFSPAVVRAQEEKPEEQEELVREGEKTGDGDEHRPILGGRTRSEMQTAANKDRALRLRAAASRQRQRAAQKAHPTTSRGGITMNRPEAADPDETRARRDLGERSAMPLGEQVEKPPEGGVLVTVGRAQYHFVADRFYRQKGEGFEIVPPPLGAVIPERPRHSSTVRANGKRYIYQSGYFYAPAGRAGYRVISPPVGAIVPYLPKGHAAQIIYGDRYYTYAGATYDPITVNGRRYYQVVRIRGR